MFSRQVRTFMTSAIRRSSHGPEGTPGDNLPIGITNRYKITAIFALFFGSGYAIPFLILRHQLLK